MRNVTRVTTILNELAENCRDDYSLYKGKTGLCICYFLLFDISKDDSHLIKARNLLDELSGNIGNVKGLGFADGLAGIGWGIEWLVQNNYVDANTDEILEDLDDELYRSVVYSR